MQTASHTEYLIVEKAARLDLALFETPKYHDMLENALRQTNRSHNFAYRGLESFANLISLVSVLALLWYITPLSIAIIGLTTLPEVLAIGRYTKRHYRKITDRASDQRMANYLAQILTARDSAKEVRIFDLASVLLQRFKSVKNTFIQDAKQQHFQVSRVELITGWLSSAGAAVVFLYAVALTLLGRGTVGDIALALQAAEQARMSFKSLFGRGHLVYEDTLYAVNLFAFLDLDEKSIEGRLAQAQETGQATGISLDLKKGIEFRDVSFCYPGSETDAVSHLSFVIHPGKCIAFVGLNGAGKTTVAKLLARLYDPTSGSILVNGTDLRDIPQAQWYEQISVIFQDFQRYELSVRENVGFGDVRFIEDENRIVKAIEHGGFDQVVRRLPRGLQTRLGKTFEGSVDISGGEWQKLAMSRAFMKEEAKVVILDEPTSELDALAELDVFSRMAELASNKMTVLISHRFSTVRMADNILVFGDGKVLEQGSHDDLMVLDGVYAQMYQAQAERYH